ncbi:trifunctional purine biosynthetic protein adenosine-3-like [Physella acuta]|uniref:trifunctional purine biosynthetic protein adenosine-3-like n=1 Tax=Physella acuta TaxID=109671 RepID=UPI0027DE3F4B|nr:trifunctional purine biosynthetic protein adenosine-3-like [Physella acuta]XP_059153844.1 trifunctional purine biosynthetic protein adenosine-3-like [Physella acuta]
MSEQILLIGSGGREHAQAWKLTKSPDVEKIYAAPGNAGTANTDKVTNVSLNLLDFQSVASWCKLHGITFVMVGPEDPLAAGIVDFLTNEGIPTFGPTAAAAQIEADKAFAKDFMIRHNIPTAKFKSFTNPGEAISFIKNADFDARVVKASGLAAGKGVVVASSKQEACDAVTEMMTKKIYGAAGDVIVVEELLQGPEASVLAFSDGHNVSLMPAAQDHKRLLDNDEGPNTGGMGAICPYPGLSELEIEFIKTNVLEKAVRGLAAEGKKFIGVLYAGIMLTKDGPKVLEFNCRFGDPETQSILSLLTSDLFTTLKACVSGDLPSALPTFDVSQTAVGVVVVSGGYPGSYKKGLPISGISEVEKNTLNVFHAGTQLDATGQVVTSGGRVLAVVATSVSPATAIQRATEGAARIQFEGAFFRKDIGMKCFKRFDASEERCGLQYKDAGVDIEAGDYLVNLIKPLAKMTRRLGCESDLGGFGGMFELKAAGFQNPVLAFRTSGVGAKIKFAESQNNHYNIGFDLVAQCVNDLISVGAEALYFLDYFATGKLIVPTAVEFIRGVSEACVQAGCGLMGGETAEMPNMYKGEDYDAVGFVVGAIPPTYTNQGLNSAACDDIVIGLTSNRLQQEDFVLVEQILNANKFKLDKMNGVNGGMTLGEEILVPSSIYGRNILQLIYSGKVKIFLNVNDGLKTCLTRVIHSGISVLVNSLSWQVGPVFGWMAYMSKLSAEEFSCVSSCGVSAILVVSRDDASFVMQNLLRIVKEDVTVMGHIIKSTGEDQVRIDNLQSSLEKAKAVAYQHAPENFGKQLGVKLPLKSDFSSILELAKKSGSVLNKDGLPSTFDMSSLKLEDPVLVSGADGVGTKLKIAMAMNNHSTIGIDLVAMCVNDVLACGAEPLFFTCYLGAKQPDDEHTEAVLKSVAQGCQIAGCAFSEEHISYLPSIYKSKVYDLAGFCVGAINKPQILPALDLIKAGDVVIGLASSGVHSNGFSLVRKIVKVNELSYDMPCPYEKNVTLGEQLLTPTEIYVKSVLPLLQSKKIKSFAHITGGGLKFNIVRVKPFNLGVKLDANLWHIPPVFGWLQFMGNVSEHDMSMTFNCGLGAVLIVDKDNVDEILSVLTKNQTRHSVIGSLVPAPEGVIDYIVIDNLNSALLKSWPRPSLPAMKKKVGVLISGSGTNLQALIDHTKSRNSCAEIALVISNVADVFGLKRAERAGIKTLVIDHKSYKSRNEFDAAVHEQLVQHQIDLVCLAGFMRILTGEFVNKWTGRMLNIHPSLLPSFKGAHAHQLALDAGVQVSGCTVHFVTEEVDGGAIITQNSVSVYPGDTTETLAERVKKVEHVAYPKALEMVASERVKIGADGKLIWNW